MYNPTVYTVQYIHIESKCAINVFAVYLHFIYRANYTVCVVYSLLKYVKCIYEHPYLHMYPYTVCHMSNEIVPITCRVCAYNKYRICFSHIANI